MSDKLNVPTGAKIRNGGVTIELTEPAEVIGQIVPKAEPQKNRHILLTCGNAECCQWQEQHNGGVQKFRATRTTCRIDDANRPMPTCGLCGNPFNFVEPKEGE